MLYRKQFSNDQQHCCLFNHQEDQTSIEGKSQKQLPIFEKAKTQKISIKSITEKLNKSILDKKTNLDKSQQSIALKTQQEKSQKASASLKNILTAQSNQKPLQKTSVKFQYKPNTSGYQSVGYFASEKQIPQVSLEMKPMSRKNIRYHTYQPIQPSRPIISSCKFLPVTRKQAIHFSTKHIQLPPVQEQKISHKHGGSQLQTTITGNLGNQKNSNDFLDISHFNEKSLQINTKQSSASVANSSQLSEEIKDVVASVIVEDEQLLKSDRKLNKLHLHNRIKVVQSFINGEDESIKASILSSSFSQWNKIKNGGFASRLL